MAPKQKSELSAWGKFFKQFVKKNAGKIPPPKLMEAATAAFKLRGASKKSKK